MPTGKKINAFFTTKKKIYDFLTARTKIYAKWEKDQLFIKCYSLKNI